MITLAAALPSISVRADALQCEVQVPIGLSAATIEVTTTTEEATMLGQGDKMTRMTDTVDALRRLLLSAIDLNRCKRTVLLKEVACER